MKEIRWDSRVQASMTGSSSSHAERGIAPSFSNGVAEGESPGWREIKSWISFLHFSLHSGWVARSMSAQHAYSGGVSWSFASCFKHGNSQMTPVLEILAKSTPMMN